MGLSDGERVDGIFHTINKLTQLGRKLKPENEFHKIIKRYINRLWPAALADKGNGAFWFFGGELSSNYLREKSLVKAAFSEVIDSAKKDDSFGYIEDSQKDVLDYFDKYAPDMVSLLTGAKSVVMEVYLTTETFMYYANRYRDELSKAVKKVRDLVAKIQGECFEEFSRNPDYVMAYMGHHIFEKVIPTIYPNKDDLIVRWAKGSHLHQSIHIPFDGREQVCEVFREVRKSAKIPMMKRVEAVLLFLKDGDYTFSYGFRDFYKFIAEHNEKYPNDLVDIDRVKSLLEEKKKRHGEAEARRGKYKPYDCLFDEEIE